MTNCICRPYKTWPVTHPSSLPAALPCSSALSLVPPQANNLGRSLSSAQAGTVFGWHGASSTGLPDAREMTGSNHPGRLACREGLGVTGWGRRHPLLKGVELELTGGQGPREGRSGIRDPPSPMDG